ncbi:uncharacterized protein LOC128547519 [Mercenaria mercenaria]|uniref:uncharacterized protein LOC128547519 n=1 Tax=Mercenaria mercenaria TaxID=6596 RepID=UPI00234E3738|nr:uncharacterized protein LOC128547519 [Mercenaria mercenaria]
MCVPGVFERSPKTVKSKLGWHWNRLSGSLILRYLASGECYKSVKYGFRVEGNTVSIIIPEVYQAIIDGFLAEMEQIPMTQKQRLAVAEMFETRWQLPHTLGDGKHVAIESPPGGGSVFYNYKKFHSIVMMSLADAEYKLLWVDVRGTWRSIRQTDMECFWNQAVC